MEERIHSSGLLVRSNGEVFIPPRMAGRRGLAPGYWTLGSLGKGRYYHVKYHGKVFSVHRLVAETFLENPENKPTVDHIDRNRLNNDVSNLRFATYKEQIENGSALRRYDYGVRKCEDRKEYNRRYLARKYGDGYKYAKMPDGSRKWIKKETAR